MTRWLGNGHKERSYGPRMCLMTELGLLEGEILLYLEAQGATDLRTLISKIPWSSQQILMAIGSLIRRGVVSGTQHSSGLLLGLAMEDSRLTALEVA